ncbi:MAG: MFS transporter, partial [Actinomycetota bacterium]|nr:MFS transporter [Actinomycetota bacterium]
PLGLLAIASAMFFLDLPKPAKRKIDLDIAGMVLIGVASTCLVLTTSWAGNTYAWNSPVIIGLIAASAIAIVSFFLVERRAAEPIMPVQLFKERNFNLTTSAGLIIGIAMFGAMAYMPTYLQMVTGANATQSGLLMIPMMAGLLVTSIGAGQLVSKTGRYKWLPITGTTIVAGSLYLLSTMTPDTPVPVLCGYLAIMGIGLGMGMQLLVLIVQDTFPAAMVGTATAANNYFRQIGAALGSAIVGSLFVSRLSASLTETLSASDGAGSSNSFTPSLVQSLPPDVQAIIVNAYNEALTPIFLLLVPIVIVAVLLLCFVHEKPLSTSIQRDILPESLEIDGRSSVLLDDRLDDTDNSRATT